MFVLLIVLTLLGLPAVLLRLACVGSSCEGGSAASAEVPFCPLPPEVRDLIGHGFWDGSSPDVLAVTTLGSRVRTRADDIVSAWPPDRADDDGRVPIVFVGKGVRPGTLAGGVGLDQIAPTIEGFLGLRRSHPEVRSGRGIDGVRTEGSADPAPLAVLIAWKGVGSRDLETAENSWPFLGSLLHSGRGTMDGVVGSLPIDPAAALTTIGSGGLPSQHGVTGSLIRSTDGSIVRAWGPKAPLAVIASLGDDLTHTFDGSRVGGILAAPGDRGIVGGGWWQDPVEDEVQIGTDPVGATQQFLGEGYGHDPAPDLLGITLQGTMREMDTATRRLVALIQERVPDAVVAVAGTGAAADDAGVDVRSVVRQVNGSAGAPIVAAGSSSGLFLDRKVLADLGSSAQAAVDALRNATAASGQAIVSDAFPAFSVTFAEYCP
jgi:hypothetical protein